MTELDAQTSESRAAFPDTLYSFAEELFPIKRSLTGPGVRQTLLKIKERLPNLQLCEIDSGTHVYDWSVPPEWHVREAFIITPSGEKICDYQVSSLHLVGYSEPVRKKLSLEQLQDRLYSIESQPTAIPYVTSYYKRRWGFCLSHEMRMNLEQGTYEVVIDSELKESGVLNYGELLIKGKSTREILFSTYICHPELANNEISGPVVNTALASWLLTMPDLHYSYRILFVPETIGAIAYISRNFDRLKENLVAGFVLTCIGDDRSYSFIRSRENSTLADRVARRAYTKLTKDFKEYSFLDRGSDERQYNAPGVELPVVTLMRTKFATYPEYHTSLDDLSIISEEGLAGGLRLAQEVVELLEAYPAPFSKILCEPQLGKRGLYPTTSFKGSADSIRNLTNVLTYCDGRRSALDLADLLELELLEVQNHLEVLQQNDIIEF